MKELRYPMFFTVLAFVLVVAGCEWEGSGSGGTWSDSYDWVNFSGVYRPVSGKTFVVSIYAPAESTPSSTGTGSDILGTGDSIESTFSGTLNNIPISAGSVSVTDGTEIFEDGASNQQLVSAYGSHGSVNYKTGAITVTFRLPPGAGNSIVVTYTYFVEGTTENPASGSSTEIYALTVTQTGNMLSFTDSNGGTYSGQFDGISTPTGTSSNVTVSSTVTATFEASGTEANGQQVTIAGAFSGDYTISTSLTQGTLQNRIVQGTWMEANGQVGDLYGNAGGKATITTANTNTVSRPWWWYYY
jgi:hypothetical protein